MKYGSFLYLFFALVLLPAFVFCNAKTARSQDFTSLFEQAGLGTAEADLTSAMSDSQSLVNLSLKPSEPDANEEVNVSLASFRFDLYSSKITWFVNGALKASGSGLDKFKFFVEEIGRPIVLRVEIETNEFGTVTEEKTIVPGGVDVLWEADTYTPPFYKGKPLPSAQSTIRAVAFPYFISEGSAIPAKDLVYTWKKTYFNDKNASGLGKNTYLLPAGYPNNVTNFELNVSSLDNTAKKVKSINVKVITPKILFYINKPLEGIRYEKQLVGEFNIEQKEAVIRAEPYYFSFSLPSINMGFFEWYLDNKKLEINPNNKSEYVIRTPDHGSGSVLLKINILHDTKKFQEANSAITLRYDNP